MNHDADQNDKAGLDGRPTVAVIGGGPAGLAAAEALAAQARVHVFDAMPSLGRKFLLAGKSGLNLTHAEDLERFLGRFGAAREALEPALRRFLPDEIRSWAAGLGIDTFVGSSGRVFPTAMKTSPLLRAWIARLRDASVAFHPRHRWVGWQTAEESQSAANAHRALAFDTPSGPYRFDADATILALGGASWPRLGSTGAWTSLLADLGVEIAPLRAANCGFDVHWSPHLSQTFAGTPVKSVALSFAGHTVRGDFVVTATGIEGSAVYALAGALREETAARGSALLSLDLSPDRSEAQLTEALSRPRGKASLATRLRKAAGLTGVKAALLRERLDAAAAADPARLAALIKALPLHLHGPRPIAEAISSAGGVALGELDHHFMLRKAPGLFAAGEMLDWEAPTGGYLLTACLATGRAAGQGAAAWLQHRERSRPPDASVHLAPGSE
ncbi:MAG: TIGR03862 family flavoprotein [Pseudomonadales bacterium]